MSWRIECLGIAVGLMLFSPVWQASACADTTASKTQLMKALDDGPLGIAETGRQCKIPKSRGIEIAYAAVTGETPPEGLDAWQTLFSDTEFPGNTIDRHLVWMVPIQRAIPKGGGIFTDIFAVVDGDSGRFIEAFTVPEQAWWKAATRMGPQMQQFYRMNAQTGLISGELPPVPLRQSLSSITQGFLHDDLPKAKQVVARYMLYTDSTVSTGVSRVDGYTNIPLRRNRPLWYILLQGVNKLVDGPLPPGVDPASLPRVQEDYALFDIEANKVTEFGEDR